MAAKSPNIVRFLILIELFYLKERNFNVKYFHLEAAHFSAFTPFVYGIGFAAHSCHFSELKDLVLALSSSKT